MPSSDDIIDDFCFFDIVSLDSSDSDSTSESWSRSSEDYT